MQIPDRKSTMVHQTEGDLGFFGTYLESDSACLFQIREPIIAWTLDTVLEQADSSVLEVEKCHALLG